MIIGGAGFIGSHLVEFLSHQKHELTVFDSFTFYFPPAQTEYYSQIATRQKSVSSKAKIIRGDAKHKNLLRRAVLENRPEIIINLAALPVADLSADQSEEAVEGVVFGNTNLLEIVREVGFVKRFVYVSSSMVYGDFEHMPADEKHPTRPKEIYGGVKLAGEVLTEAYGRRFGIEYSIIRPSAVYGPGDVNRRVLQIFVENAMTGKPLEVRGSDTMLDFTHVADTVAGIGRVATLPGGANGIFNITRGEGRTLEEAAVIIGELIPGVSIEIQKVESHRPKRGALDVSRARKLVGYEPQFDLASGLASYVHHLQSLES